MRRTRERRVTLTGILHPAQWDAAGNVLGLALSTGTDDEFALHGKRLSDLLPLCREEVEVHGLLRDGVVEIKRIRRLDDDMATVRTGSLFSEEALEQ